MRNFDIKDKRNIFMIVMVVLILAIVGWFYNNYWADFQIKKDKLNQEILKKKKTLREVELKRKQKKKMEADLVMAEKQYQIYRKMFPDKEKVPYRLRDLYGVIQGSGVRIRQFRPVGVNAREQFNENNYEILVESGYHMLGHLFADIANFEYPTAIRGLSINRYGGVKTEIENAEKHGWTPITLTVKFTLTTFSSKDSGK